MKTHSIAVAAASCCMSKETGNPDGESILFIHGFSHCHLVWSKQQRSDLARELRMVSMDIRGHGLSDKPRDGIAPLAPRRVGFHAQLSDRRR